MAKEKVRIGVATPPGMTAANGYFSAASALGYDREEGLAFEMYYGDEPGTTARALCVGKCDIASLNTTVGLLGREEKLPMTAVYGKARRTHRWFAVMPQSSIRSLSKQPRLQKEVPKKSWCKRSAGIPETAIPPLPLNRPSPSLYRQTQDIACPLEIRFVLADTHLVCAILFSLPAQ
jgi:hypothetical protein